MLAKSFFLTKALAAFHLKGDHFVSLYMIEDLGFDGRLYSFAHTQLTILAMNEHDIRELYFVSYFSCKLVHENLLVFTYFELLTGNVDNYEHNLTNVN